MAQVCDEPMRAENGRDPNRHRRPLRRRSRRIDWRASAIFILVFVLCPTLLTLHMLRVHRLSRELISAVRSPDVAAVRSLLDRGADPNARDIPDQTGGLWEALRQAFIPSSRRKVEQYRTALMVAVVDGQLETVRELLKRGAAPSAMAAGAEQAVIIAGRLGAADRVRLLLDSGAKVNARDTAGETALMAACAREDPYDSRHMNGSGETFSGDATARLLLDRGADAAPKDVTGKSAMSYALDRGRDDLLIPLLEHGGDPDARGQYGTSVVEGALNDEQYDDRGEQKAKGIDLLAVALAHGANPNLLHDGATPLVSAVHENSATAVRLLLEHRGNPNAVDSEGVPVLLWAIERGEVEKALLLLQHGADIEAHGAGRGALATAVTLRHPGLVSELLRHGAKVDAADAHGTTPLMVAAYNGDADIVRLLLKSGASRGAKDADGRRAADYAADSSIAAQVQPRR